MTMMYEVGMDATLQTDRPVTAEEMTDYIERLVDQLDELGHEGDVTTSGVGGSIKVTVSVTVHADAEMDAAAAGISAIASAFALIGTETPFPAGPQAITPRALQPA